MRGGGWVFGALILTGCYTAPEGWDTPAASGGATGAGCVAGMRVECPCTDGSTGVQECNPDGLSYGSCECSGGGGTGGGSVDGSGGLGGAAPGVGGDVATGGSDSGGTGGAPGPQGPRCDWVSECEPLDGPCTVTYTVMCGAVEYGSVSCGLEHEKRIGWAFGDGHSIICPAGESDCIAEGQEASSYCAELIAGGSGGGGGGSGGTGGGAEPTVVWSDDYHRSDLVTPAHLDGFEFYLELSPNSPGVDCNLTFGRGPTFAYGYSGVREIPLSTSERACLGHGAAMTLLAIRSHETGSSSSRLVTRPGPHGIDWDEPTLRFIHTVRAFVKTPESLGSAGEWHDLEIDETWALVVE